MRNILTHPAQSVDPKRTGDTVIGTSGHFMQVIPVTLTVLAGPAIAIVYRLTQSEGAAADSFSLAQPIRGLLCLLMFVSLFVSKGLGLLKHRFVRPLLFLAVYAVLATFASQSPYGNIVFGAKMIFITLVFVSAFQLGEQRLCGERWLPACAWFILLVMAVCIGSGLAAGRTVVAYASQYATAGIIGQPFIASCLILSTMPVFIRLLPKTHSATAGIALLFASLFFTMCRNGVIAAVAAMCGCFLINLSPFGRVPWRRFLLPIGVFFLLACVGLGTSPGSDLVERFRDLSPSEGTGSGRYEIWRVSLRHTMRRPMRARVLGEGRGSIRKVVGQHTGHDVGSHNDWLDFVSSFGLCGLIGISWLSFEMLRFTWGLRGRQDGLFAGACAFVIILGLMSIGTGGSFEPSWALSYAAMGFWAGNAAYAKQHCRTEVN